VVVAGFTAGEAVKVTILHQTDVVLALAQDAIALAVALLLSLATLVTDEFLCHVMLNSSVFLAQKKDPEGQPTSAPLGISQLPSHQDPCL
jgi:hypothetical protein